MNADYFSWQLPKARHPLIHERNARDIKAHPNTENSRALGMFGLYLARFY
jgi:hypothetical protein